MACLQLSAKRGHGKNQYADYLKQALEEKGKKVKLIAYRDILKQLSDDFYQKLKIYFKDDYQFDKIDNSIKDNQKGMEFRRAWWTTGGRYIKKYFGGQAWINALFTEQFNQNNFYYPEYKDNFTIITDLRFKNEFDFARNHKFKDKIKLIRIYRPGDHPRAGYMGTTEKFVNDKSEVDLDYINKQQWDRFVLNDKGLQELKKDAYQYIDILYKDL